MLLCWCYRCCCSVSCVCSLACFLVHAVACLRLVRGFCRRRWRCCVLLLSLVCSPLMCTSCVLCIHEPARSVACPRAYVQCQSMLVDKRMPVCARALVRGPTRERIHAPVVSTCAYGVRSGHVWCAIRLRPVRTHRRADGVHVCVRCAIRQTL